MPVINKGLATRYTLDEAYRIAETVSTKLTNPVKGLEAAIYQYLANSNKQDSDNFIDFIKAQGN